jgi:hypothetical protein
MNNSKNKLTSKRRNSKSNSKTKTKSKSKSKSKSSSPQRRHSRSSRSRSRSRSSSRSSSRSRSSSGSSIEGLPVLIRQHKEINNLSPNQIGQIISNRVKKAQIHPPKNWNKWNKNNAELSKTKSVPYPEYNEVFDNNNYLDII